MEKEKEYPLPFITRKMLNFEFGTRFELKIFARSKTTDEINIVGATKEGVFTYKHITSTSDSGNTATFSLSDMPIWITVCDINNAIKQGNLWVKVDLQVNGNILQTLCSGYVHQYKSITWPTTGNEQQLKSYGFFDVYTGANPAAGSETTITMPNGELWRITAITFTLTTSATVANRRVHVKINPKQNGSYDIISSVDQAASTARIYSCIPIGGAGTYSDDNDIIIPLPFDLWLPGESTITTSTTNIQAGDDFGVMTVHYERYLAPLN